MRGRTNVLRPSGLAACVAAGALLSAAPALASTPHSSRATTATTTSTPLTPPSGATVSVQGVVQSISSSTVLVKQLDGSAVIVPIDRTTQIFVNGKSAHTSDVKRGYVLIASFQTGRPAGVLRFVRPS
jgi:ABC-type transport system substrate-binding protein